ncbi:MAG: undecaprenyl-diphosphatase [Patescibacteria group bacterium]|nr:undecaprenyl-diphosphatase [Patescibacteria group bacterium]
MTLLQSFILGVVEGLTEFLPISSTGHLVLVQTLMRIEQSQFLVTFDIAIQVGAILAVIVFYWHELWNFNLIKKLILGFIPTGIIGFTVFKYIKLLLNNPFIVVFTLFVGGIIIILAEKWYKKKLSEVGVSSHIGYKEAFLLGLLQTLAIVPGVSRSGAIIVGGMFMRLERKALTEFTFLLAVPTMCAATLYSIYKHPEVLTAGGNLSALLIGLATSFMVALIVIKVFINYIRTRSFSVFGYYRIVLSIIAFIILSNVVS